VQYFDVEAEYPGAKPIKAWVDKVSVEEKALEQLKNTARMPDKNLAYLPESNPLFGDYVSAVELAQEYARINRELMMESVAQAVTNMLGRTTIFDVMINCHHNYIAKEHHFGSNVIVTRKGAVRARVGDLGIIPGSMGAKSYIVSGRGNNESFHSCSHGAGRKMSRGAAERTFTVSDLALQTRGVECRKDSGILDEIPGAYKDIDDVMASQTDLVDIVHTLHQVLNVKG
jgi:tRNA-splicing ligase RtcB